MPMIGVRDRLRVLRREKPHWSLGDLAHELGVTRERVRQLLKAEGLRTKRIRPVDVIDDALSGLVQGVKPPAKPHASPEPGHDAQDDTTRDAGELLSAMMRRSVEL